MDGFDATSQRYVLRVFTGQPGAKPKIVAWKMKYFWVILGGFSNILCNIGVYYIITHTHIYIHNIFITYIYIYIYRYSIIKSFGFESIPQQLNTNVIRGLVKRAQLL